MPALFVFLMLLAYPSWAELYYQCIDANGHQTFQQMPCVQNTQQEIKESLSQGNFINNSNNSVATYQQIKNYND